MKMIKELIVVEGKTDVAFLSQFVQGQFLITHGLNVDEELLKEIGSFIPEPGVVILTDPDGPGEKIRRQILERFPQCKNAYVPTKEAKVMGKIGVAQSNKKAVLNALMNCVTFSHQVKSNLSLFDLYEIGLFGNLHSQEIRQQFSIDFHLGFSNAKTLLKKINSLSISKERLIQWRVSYDQANSNS